MNTKIWDFFLKQFDSNDKQLLDIMTRYLDDFNYVDLTKRVKDYFSANFVQEVYRTLNLALDALVVSFLF